MAILKNFNVATVTDVERIQVQVQVQQEWLPFTNPIKGQESNIPNRTLAGRISRKVFAVLFYLQLFLIAIFAILLTIFGILSASPNFYPLKWYLPLFASTACAGVLGFTWQWITAKIPTKAIRAAFWLSPLLTVAMGVMLVYIESEVSFAVGVVVLVSALIQSLYGCWVIPRFEYATQILSISIDNPPTKTKTIAFSSILVAVLYCCLLISGIRGARAIENRTKLAFLFIFVILLSLGWTMQFLRNVVLVPISRVKYMDLHGGDGVDMDTTLALKIAVRLLSGSLSIGSILVPIFSLFRGFARSMRQVGGGVDEFMFSCVSCYMWIASWLVTCGNRWGFVYVGVYNMGFVQASSDTWRLFKRAGLEQLIDSDITGSFCFLSGVAGGAISSLVCGIWSIVIHKSYAAEMSIYAFLIGYFMFRLALAWIQACVSAYYVSYAENPESPQFGHAIRVRLVQLERIQS